MLASVLRTVLPLGLAGVLGVQSAHADIYTWVDASGALNVSNLAPPDDARVLRVTKDAPAPAVDAQALAERVKQLEAQVAQAQRPMPPVDYVPPPMPVQYPQMAPPVVQYIFQASPAMQYSVPQPPAQYYAPQYDSTDYWAGNYTGNWAGNAWCDPNWLNCGWGPYGWAPGFYPPSVIVVNTSNPKRGRPGNGFVPGHRPPTRPPIVTPFTTNPVAPLTTSFAPPMGTSMGAPRRAVAAVAPHRG